MHFTVFYAWQSDRPGNVNRNFVEQALKKAIDEINADAEVLDSPRPELDKDTQGVGGARGITDIILEKIEECGVFVADVTPTGRSDTVPEGRTAKLQPNPNVVFELGYALRCLSDDRIVMVLNTAYGLPDDLPFDLRYRKLVTYRAAEGDADKSMARRELLENLKMQFERRPRSYHNLSRRAHPNSSERSARNSKPLLLQTSFTGCALIAG